MSTAIDIEDVSKRFGTHTALDRVSLDIRSGELLAVLGPSGSGKTTLLRIIAGLEAADGGRVLFNGEDMRRRNPRERRVGFVFQHYALFRHMTVNENIAFGLRVRPRGQRLSQAEIARRVESLLHLVQLDGLEGRFPHQLSGGQRQRVALARALAIQPRVLLLDEPFGALDAKVRKELRRWLRRLHDTVRVTSVFVTHDQDEALELADRVVVMAEGRVEQVGAPEEVYTTPASAFVHEFLGNTNRLECLVKGGWVTLADGTLLGRTDAAAGLAIAYIRPHDLMLRPMSDGTGIVQRVQYRGAIMRVEVLFAGSTLGAVLPADPEPQIKQGDRVMVTARGGRVFSRGRTEGAPLIGPLLGTPCLSIAAG